MNFFNRPTQKSFETLKIPQYKKLSLLVCNDRTFSLLHRFQENDVRERMWDKLKCYWEHLGEQVWETIKNFVITHWELGGNTNENNKSPKKSNTIAPSPPQKKGLLSLCCNFSLTKHKFYLLISFIDYFSLG
jgi:hypothetical protein